jgi:F0F1-type ATP synthase assembly protein I
MAQSEKSPRGILYTLLVVMIGLVGCLTLVVIFTGLFIGRWLDNVFGTSPILTIVLLLAGIPISIILMLYVARRTLDRLKSESATEKEEISS